MATGNQLNNLGVCGNANLVGYNTQRGCPYNFQNTIEIWRTPSDFEFDDTVEFDADYIKSLQLAGNLSIIKGITDFPETGTDPLIETLPDNTEISAGDAKYKYSPVFASGDLWFNKLLGYIEGQGNNRFIFVDSAGNMLMTRGSEEGKSRGFLSSRTHRAKFTLQSPGVGQKATLDFQLANTYELEDNFVFRSSDTLGFDPRLIEAVIQATPSFTATPTDNSTDLTVDLKVSRGLSDFVTGATTVSNWLVTVNNSVVTVSNVAEASNVYTLTIPAVATDDVVEVSLNGVIEITGDGLYRSFSVSATTLA